MPLEPKHCLWHKGIEALVIHQWAECIFPTMRKHMAWIVGDSCLFMLIYRDEYLLTIVYKKWLSSDNDESNNTL